MNARTDLAATVFAPLHQSRYLARLGSVAGRGLCLPPLPERAGRRLAIVLGLALRARLRARPAPDVLHETGYSGAGCADLGIPSVVTVYDMIHERFAGSLPPSDVPEAKRRAVARARHVICISEHTRRDLMDILGVEPERTSVVPMGSSFEDMAPVEPPGAGDRPLTDFPFLLYVGGRGFYKNFPVLLASLRQVPGIARSVGLVCIGGPPFSAQEWHALRRSGLSPRRVLHIRGDDTLLARAYRQALALVYPSAYEGFGIPPLEAMSLGCPVITTRAASLPEVVGDAALLVAPGDPAELAHAIGILLEDEGLGAGLRARGRERARRFSWRRCAEGVVAAWQRARAA